MKTFKTFLPAFGAALALTGCADFQLPELPQLPQLQPPATLTESVETICAEFHKNKLRAEALYLNKVLQGVGTFDSASDSKGSFYDAATRSARTLGLSITVKKTQSVWNDQRVSISLPYTPSNHRAVMALNVGDRVSFSGTIDSIGDTDSCWIGLKLSSFSKQ